jgi:hypothetical protein
MTPTGEQASDHIKREALIAIVRGDFAVPELCERSITTRKGNETRWTRNDCW